MLKLCATCLLFVGTAAATAAPLQDKTLVVWVTPADLNQQGGSALTIDDTQTHFDGIIFAELSPAKWMADSDFHRRTQNEQDAYPVETADASTYTRISDGGLRK